MREATTDGDIGYRFLGATGSYVTGGITGYALCLTDEGLLVIPAAGVGGGDRGSGWEPSV
ncbi:MAG: hypothetical protein OXF96_04940 [Chloroflexi bacterium]|nr:hypothetical protein [Chloroflexota bacterium]